MSTNKYLISQKDVKELADLINVYKNIKKSSSISGSVESRKWGRGIEFDHLREYSSDDSRFIHWRSSLKSNKIYTKVFTEDKESSFVCFFIVDDSLFFGSTNRLTVVSQFYSLVIISMHALMNNNTITINYYYKNQFLTYKINNNISAFKVLMEIASSINHIINELLIIDKPVDLVFKKILVDKKVLNNSSVFFLSSYFAYEYSKDFMTSVLKSKIKFLIYLDDIYKKVSNKNDNLFLSKSGIIQGATVSKELNHIFDNLQNDSIIFNSLTKQELVNYLLVV